MRSVIFLTCLAALSAVVACSGKDQHYYYDAKGNPANLTNDIQRRHAMQNAYDSPARFDRAGYYDAKGNYIADPRVGVPDSLLPSRGMCRIWFVNSAPENQPPVEKCEGIRGHVPAGAYVIYGG